MTLGRPFFVYISETEHFLHKQCTVCVAFADADTDAIFLELLLSGVSQFLCFFAFFLLFMQSLATGSIKVEPAI